MAVQIPVFAKEPVRRDSPGQYDERIPKANFDVVFVRIGGNNKTSDNVTDTVRGCSGGCYGCYAARSMGVFQGRRRFDQPEAQICVFEMVQHDLLEMVRKEPYLDWVRNGVMGDPSLDWDSAVALAEAAGRVGIRTVIISKFWTMPTDEHLMRLALSGSDSSFQPHFWLRMGTGLVGWTRRRQPSKRHLQCACCIRQNDEAIRHEGRLILFT